MAGYVLIVESDPELQRRIGDALREGRYELASEAEGKWAQRSIAVRAPDAVVIDTQLSDGDGFHLAEELRRDPDTRDAPIFFIASSHRGSHHRAEARRRFAPAEYLSTPLDTNSLLALMLQALPPGTGTGDAAANPPRPAAAPDVAQLVAALDGVLTDPVQQRERRNVERAAKSLAGEKAEFQGTLKRVPFARLLRRLYAQKATGQLLLLRDAAKKDATKKIVNFEGGYPVSVKSNVLAECLGQILVGRKLITEKALGDSVARMKTERRQQGQILVEMGALSPYNLQRALVEQVETKLLEVFAWPDGKFMFKDSEVALEDTSPGQSLRLERPPAALIFEGIRRHYDAARQRAVLDAYVRQSVELNPDPVLRLQDVTTDPTALAYINSIDGSDSIGEILARAPIAMDEARLLLVALSEAGMITHAEGASARRRGAPTAAAAALPRRPRASWPPSRRPRRRARSRSDSSRWWPRPCARRTTSGRSASSATPRRPTSTAPTTRTRAASTPIAIGTAPTRTDGSRRRSSIASARRTARCAIRADDDPTSPSSIGRTSAAPTATLAATTA